MKISQAMRSRGNTGATSELIASADLLRRGFDVFRAVSPHCPCDLVAMRDGVCLRVEVRTGTVGSEADYVRISLRETDRFDVMAIAVGNSVGYLGRMFAPEEFPFRITDALKVRILAKVYPDVISEGRG